MPDNVTRLKQLLFDNEAEALADLSRKLDLLHQDRVEANRRFDAVFKRAGTDERLQKSVANVLDGAFRDAEVANHDRLANSVAPVVVNTVKVEIRNSRDDIAEALYPMTGRMVKAYIASAMKELTEKLNRKLESNPFMLRLRAMTSGRPVSELLLADSQRVELDELFLIRRGTGELLARWPSNDAGHNQDQVMSGVLTAINDFASEALKDEGTSLREIDLGERQVYLRASPSYLLAAKCAGTGTAAVEKVFDEAFLSAIGQLHDLNDNEEIDDGPETKARLLALLAGDLREDLEAVQPAPVSPAKGEGGSGLSILAWIVGVPLSLWMCWLVYENYWRARVRDVANQIVVSSSELKGYPTTFTVSSRGKAIALSGLAPTRYTKESLVNRLQLALPGTEINAGKLAVVPSGDHVADKLIKLREEIGKFRPDIAALRGSLSEVETQIARATVRENLARAHRSVQTVLTEIPQLQADIEADNELALVARLSETAKSADRQLKEFLTQATTADVGWAELQDLGKDVERLHADIARRAGEMSTLLINPNDARKLPGAIEGRQSGLAGDARVLAVDSNHLATITVSVAQLAALKKRLPKPPPPPKPYTPSARQQLEEFARRNAVFFASGTRYRNARDAARVLDELASHMGQTKAVVRVVGYTDEKGSSDQNTPLSQSRADKVTDALRRRGVPSARLVSLGRKDNRDISTDTGARSANRRVEFEVGFENEIGR